MLFEPNILPIVIAGLMNGSFVIPARRIKNFTTEKVWLYHSIIGLVIIPWLLLAFIFPQSFHDYLALQPSVLLFLISSGVIFGLGQVCFSYAIKSIGIALSFTINLGIGVTIGSMFIVLYKGTFFTNQGYLVTLAVLLILSSLFIHYISGKNRNLQTNVAHNSHYHTGWLLACLTGLTSGLQNITFVIVAFHTETLFKSSNSFWVWPPFLFAAAIPMMLGFLYKIKKHQRNESSKPSVVRNTFLLMIMGLFFTGSLALYSSGMNELTRQQQIIGWPAFMVSIILASQIWGLLHGEANGATTRNKFIMALSILLLVGAIIILAFEA